MTSLAQETADLLARLGVPARAYTGGSLDVTSPITGEHIAAVVETDSAGCDIAIAEAAAAFKTWRLTPAPKRAASATNTCDRPIRASCTARSAPSARSARCARCPATTR